MYRAAMFMVEDPTTNPTSPVHKGVITWKGLSPVASECLWSGVSLLSPREQGEDLLCDSEYNQGRNTQGGAQSRRVIVGLNPSVAARVGKNVLDEREVVIQVRHY
jgi:hypothetical protein